MLEKTVLSCLSGMGDEAVLIAQELKTCDFKVEKSSVDMLIPKQEEVDVLLLDLDALMKTQTELNNVKQILQDQYSDAVVYFLMDETNTSAKEKFLTETGFKYMSKSFSPKFIADRINNECGVDDSIRYGDLFINKLTHEVMVGDNPIDLTYSQFKILYFMASHKHKQIFTGDEILEAVWGEHAYITTDVVDAHIKRLRYKLDELCPSRYILKMDESRYEFSQYNLKDVQKVK